MIEICLRKQREEKDRQRRNEERQAEEEERKRRAEREKREELELQKKQERERKTAEVAGSVKKDIVQKQKKLDEEVIT